MPTGCPAVRETLAVLVVGGWFAQLSITCRPLTNSRLPSSLVRANWYVPVVGGLSVPVHFADQPFPGMPDIGGCPPHRKFTFGSFRVATGVPDRPVLS